MNGYHAKKRFGQHFLNSPEIIARIVGLIQPSPDDIIIEIGPGQGVITVPLAESGARLVAVEFDRDIVPLLKKKFAENPRVEIINTDFLQYTPDALTAEKFVLAGNLPYNITSPVLEWAVRYHHRIDRAVFMVQKEMAARIAAVPATHDWSPLAIFTQLHYQVKFGFDVPPSCFTPPPAVMSAVIRLDPVERPQPRDPQLFERVVRAAFGHRRKVLANNLVPSIVPAQTAMKTFLSELGLRPDVRAEQIPIDQFMAIVEYCEDHGFE